MVKSTSANQTSALSHGNVLLSSSKPFPLFFTGKQINHQSASESYSPTSKSFDYKIPFTVTVQLIAGTFFTKYYI